MIGLFDAYQNREQNNDDNEAIELVLRHSRPLLFRSSIKPNWLPSPQGS